MDMNISLTQEQIQKLSAVQLQSLQILAMSSEDLRSLLQKESEENPFLDYHPSSAHDGTAEFLRFIAAQEEDRVKTFIMEQLNPNHFGKQQWALLTYLAQYVDAGGYLNVDEAAIKRLPLPEGMYEKTLAVLQGLNPPGICATTLEECLKLQLKRKNRLTDLAAAVIDNHLEDLGKNRIAQISQALGVSRQRLMPTIRLVKSLDPSPLKGLFAHTEAYVVPDVIIRLTESGHETLLNDTWTNSYSMSDYYVGMMRKAGDADIKTYFQQKYARCYLLLRNIERRRETLLTLTEAIWDWQYEYVRRHKALRPMTLKNIAQATGLHISTISRAVKDKYLQTPWRTVSFKQLFQSPLHGNGRSVSKDAVKHKLAALIAGEDKQNPYSDFRLTELISAHFGAPVSRRVVQKYRKILRIPNSYERKRGT